MAREQVDLAGAVIPYSDLSDTNLTSANLKGTTLSHADLSGTDLSDAILVEAVLTHANLSNTNLSHANLSRANLAGADLTGANLTGADLDGADLGNAKLRGANLDHASNVAWDRLLDAHIDESTKLPKDLGAGSFFETLERIFLGVDLRADFGEIYDNYPDLLLKLIEVAGENTISEFARNVRMGLMLKERGSAGLNDEPSEFKDD